MAVGFPVKTTYANGDVYSAGDVNDTNGTLNLLTSTQSAAGKNAVINGGFEIWQRGTSSAGNAYLADRWYSALISGTGTFAQEGTVVPPNAYFSMKFTASATAQPALYQAIELLNTIPYTGQTVTVSAMVAASTSVPMTIDVQHSSTADNSVTGTWTSITPTSGGTATPTSTTFVPISGVYAIPSSARSLRVRLFTTSTIANGVVVYFDNVQLELGSTVSAFARACGNIEGELAACYRYYQKTGANPLWSGNVTTGLTYYMTCQMPVIMRVAPTCTFTITNNNGFPATNPGASTITVGTIWATAVANTTGGAAFFGFTYTANAEL